MRIALLISLIGALCLLGCGTPGAPLPPSLNIPRPVKDLHAVRKGGSVALTWTPPQQTTDGALIKKPGKMAVKRALLASGDLPRFLSQGLPADKFGTPVSELSLPPALKEKRQQTITAQDALLQLLHLNPAADFVVYSVETSSPSGKTAGESNQVAVPLIEIPAPPNPISAVMVSTGVKLSWDESSPPPAMPSIAATYSYKLMRRLEDSAQPSIVAQFPAMPGPGQYVDTNIEWQKRYQYWLVPIAKWQADDRAAQGEFEGDDSPVVSISTTDVFPPAVPTGVQAVFSKNGQQLFIDLTWFPNSETDLAGYNVYRRDEGSQATKINVELVKAPAFRDNAVQPGVTYWYSVSAVDLRGNESTRSQEASETVPP